MTQQRPRPPAGRPVTAGAPRTRPVLEAGGTRRDRRPSTARRTADGAGYHQWRIGAPTSRATAVDAADDVSSGTRSPYPDTATSFTARRGGDVVRRFRVGSPSGRRPSSGRRASSAPDDDWLSANMDLTEEEKQHFDDYQRLRCTISTLTERLDSVIAMFADETSGARRSHGDASTVDGLDLSVDDVLLQKTERLGRMVQEQESELSLAKRRIVLLEDRLQEASEELSLCQSNLAREKQQHADTKAELDKAMMELKETRAQASLGERKAADLENQKQHFQKLAVESIKSRRTRDSPSPNAPAGRDWSGLSGSPSPRAREEMEETRGLTMVERLHRHEGAPAGGEVPGPTGRVALVFTDIQGSTNLWEMLQDRMHGQLEKHNDLIRQEIKRWKGYEVKTQGDSFMVAFSKPMNAVCFCMSVQLVLLRAKWEPLLDGCKHSVRRVVTNEEGQEVVVWNGLRVRMGAHVGDPICQVDVTSGRMDYFGPVVNQAARVQGVAKGGMVTLTPEMIEDMERDKMPAHLAPDLYPIGSFALKGIENPVPLQHALPPILAPRVDDFPPPNSKDVKDDQEIIQAAGAPTGNVTFCLLRMEKAAEIEAAGAALWEETLDLFRNEVRVSCEIVGGYVSRMDRDRLTVVFQHAAVAFRWAMELQENMMRLGWPDELLSLPAGEVRIWRNKDLTRGARVQIGMHACEDCDPFVDPITKQVSYQGPGILVAGALSLVAKGGETLVSETVHDIVHETVRDKFLLAHPGLQLNEWKEPLDCWLAYPRNLTGRAAFFREIPLEEFEGIDEDDVDEDVKAAQTNAPYGNVSIVFTDIQNSTKLWDTNEKLMARVVKLHHIAMRAGIQRFQGYEVKTEGDAFMVAFSDPMDAVRWTLYMQETLLALAYPEEFLRGDDARVEKCVGTVIWKGVRVRMGVHSGQPSCEVDPVTKRMDYYGPMVNKAARVSSLAQGGQVVISEDTYDKVKDQQKELGAPVITYGGEHSLKGISKATKVYFMLPQRLKGRTFKTTDKKPPAPEGEKQQQAQSQQQLNGMDRMHANIEEDDQVRQTAALAVAPTGRVALCFTDIQNSTHLWENCERMAQCVQLHHRVMRKGIAKHDGYEVKTEGDAFMVAFSSSINALAWCLDMQHALMEQSWDHQLLDLDDARIDYRGPPGKGVRIWGGPRVRMGVHVGGPADLACETDPVSGRMDYYGRMVNKAARVGGKGKGGETVISGDVYDEIEAGGAKVRSILQHPDIQFVGEQTLKGIQGTTRIYSCVPNDLKLRRDTWKQMDEKKEAQVGPKADERWAQLEAEYERREREKKDAPRDVVTLVFTDIQSSTELWDQYEPQMKQAVDMHHALMREWIDKQRGYEVKTEGDAFMIAFHNPVDALQWCIGTQIELMKLDWPKEMLAHRWAEQHRAEDGSWVWNGPRVRMGVHTGKMNADIDPTMQRYDYYGPEVNKAARIGGLGTGGEIVASEQALDGAKKLSPDLEKLGRPIVLHLGAKVLKGISKPANAFRIIPTALAGRNYPPKETPAPPVESKLESVVTARPVEEQRRPPRGRRTSGSGPPDDDGGDFAPYGRERRGGAIVQRGEDLSLYKARVEKEKEAALEEVEAQKEQLEKLKQSERKIQLEFWRTHRHVRLWVSHVKKYIDCSVDRSKGLYSSNDLLHDWIMNHRKIMEIEDPNSTDEPLIKKKGGTKEELRQQLQLAIETEEKERVLGLNEKKEVVVSKLAPSIVAHLSKQMVFLFKFIEPKRRGTRSGADAGPLPMQRRNADRHGSRKSIAPAAHLGDQVMARRGAQRASVSPMHPGFAEGRQLANLSAPEMTREETFTPGRRASGPDSPRGAFGAPRARRAGGRERTVGLSEPPTLQQQPPAGAPPTVAPVAPQEPATPAEAHSPRLAPEALDAPLAPDPITTPNLDTAIQATQVRTSLKGGGHRESELEVASPLARPDVLGRFRFGEDGEVEGAERTDFSPGHRSSTGRRVSIDMPARASTTHTRTQRNQSEGSRRSMGVTPRTSVVTDTTAARTSRNGSGSTGGRRLSRESGGSTQALGPRGASTQMFTFPHLAQDSGLDQRSDTAAADDDRSRQLIGFAAGAFGSGGGADAQQFTLPQHPPPPLRPPDNLRPVLRNAPPPRSSLPTGPPGGGSTDP